MTKGRRRAAIGNFELPVKFLHSGDSAIVVEFGDRVDRAVSEEVLALAARLRAAAITGVIETVPTFRSLMIHYDPLVLTAAALVERVTGLLAGAVSAEARRRL